MEQQHNNGKKVPTQEVGHSAGIESRTVSFPAIFSLFFKVGLMSVGGGLAAWIYREAVDRHRWLTATDFLSGLALSQVLPGVNVANLSIYIGERLRGVPGAVTALIGLILAPFFIIIGLAAVYAQIKAIPWAHNFLSGVATAAVGLVMSVTLKSIRHAMHGIGPFAIMTIIVLTVGILRWPMVPVVLSITPISVLLAWKTRGGDGAR